ncbi:glutathione S-transferase [Fragilariopsis cylindrus CCMP1102]|uniref:Glutathione S-transferase n=1 Tax=Fragilariopsis cylindrus CCMP1102 TaxID=635003 RepID=A0A1E7EKY2_9STRA|nr:glutathione S-transferase [Fragilariopsis cylindrus CCMP1102]|eukprot:OEU06544.1 glutathione S-transferase [Fragilariopsis cylindrus CCMP1102]
MHTLQKYMRCYYAHTSGFVAAGRIPYHHRIISELKGGYDATIGAAPSTPLQFFTMPGNTCPYAQRTMIALKELQLPFDITEVSGMPKPDWFLSINPRGKVPTLRVPTADYAIIYESAICNEFLCDYATSIEREHTLMPTDPFIRARIRLLNDHCDNVFARTQFTYLMNKEDDKNDELCTDMESALNTYEEALVGSEGSYLLGGDFTLADVHVFPFIQRLVITLKHYKDYELQKDKFPKLLAWIDICLARESVKESSMAKEKTISVYDRFVNGDYKFGGLNKNK